MKTITEETLKTIAELQADDFTNERERNAKWGSLFKDCEALISNIASKRIKINVDNRWDEDDFRQEVYITLSSKINEIHPSTVSEFSGWLFETANNVINMHHRKEAHTINGVEVSFIGPDKKDEILDRIPSASNPNRKFDRQYINQLLRKEIEKCPENYKNTLLLELKGKKANEIAAAMGCSTSDIYNYTKRGHKKLKELILQDNLYEALADEYGLAC